MRTNSISLKTVQNSFSFLLIVVVSTFTPPQAPLLPSGHACKDIRFVCDAPAWEAAVVINRDQGRDLRVTCHIYISSAMVADTNSPEYPCFFVLELTKIRIYQAQ